MKVFLNEPIHKDAYEVLQNHYEIIDDLSHINECKVVISRNLQLNKDFLKKCTSLKLIAIHGSGYDDVDVEYAKSQNIHLINTPGQNALSVAELNVALMLELSRKIYHLHNDKLNGNIQCVAPIQYMGSEVSYKTAGFIGYGHVAKQTIAILKNGFHMNIHVYSPDLTQEQALLDGIQNSSIDEVFMSSDYIFICCPLNQDTYRLVNHKYLSFMKNTAYIINTARGAIIDEDDLYNALYHHKIAGAGLDVMEGEPICHHHPLFNLENVIYTSHMGASTDDALKRVGLCVVEGVIDYIEKGTTKYLVF